ncbi:MAG: hypothetical protein WC548_03425 [Candidatus Pacearchaeota archaeon]
MTIGFIVIEMKNIIITTGTEAFGVKRHASATTFAFPDFWLPFKFFITSVTEAFGVMSFVFVAV